MSAEKPNYYKVKIKGVEVECLDVIDVLDLGFCLGNTLKYIWRGGRKTPDILQDLRKARVYLDREIANLEVEALQAMQEPKDGE